ncbi:MAG TPA: EboA domain-containing protein, partial [Chitinophagaceae bacterium]|nr:EboA domain-containing protein [Chitinophagaceae bacterium]
MTEEYLYDIASFTNLLDHKIQTELSPDNWNWINEKANGGPANMRMAFASIPRKIGKAPIQFTTEEEAAMQQLRPELSINAWPIDRLCRVWLLLHVPSADKDQYVKEIDTLFLSAEMNELVALYSALPLLAYPEAWRKRCAEGIRSNIGDVLQAIICNNPYPS